MNFKGARPPFIIYHSPFTLRFCQNGELTIDDSIYKGESNCKIRKLT